MGPSGSQLADQCLHDASRNMEVPRLYREKEEKMKPSQIAREDFMRILYWLGIPWHLYRWYQRGGSARALSIFIGQNIKFWRDFL